MEVLYGTTTVAKASRVYDLPPEIEPRIDAASVTAQPSHRPHPTSLSMVSTMETMDTMAI